MGFFQKKKNRNDQASTLSETEIQKKLYGEFKTDTVGPVTGEREGAKTSSHFGGTRPEPRADESISSGRSAPDLFTLPAAVVVSTETHSAKSEPEKKSVDFSPKTISLNSAEKKKNPDSFASRVDLSSKAYFPKASSLSKVSSGMMTQVNSLLNSFFDPARSFPRLFLIWGSVVLVIVLLFGGVNALNSRREIAMREKYKMPTVNPAVAVAKTPSELPSVPVPAVLEKPAKQEREVTITPVKHLPAATTKPKLATAIPSARSAFVIQVVTYPSLEDAQRVVDTLKRDKLDAFFKENTRPSGRVFYVVMLGGFRTEAEAQAQLTKFRAKEVARPFQDAFVKSIS